MPELLNERTGVHHCIRCRAEVPREEYFAGDFVCGACLATPPEASTSTHGDQHEHTQCCGSTGRAARGEVRA